MGFVLSKVWRKPDTDQSASPLLNLPPEIRNIIYQLCLIEDSIEITDALKPPGLLSACRQTRNEALPIWYLSNTFKSMIVDCDASIHRKFGCNLVDPVRDQIGDYLEVHMHLDGSNVANLREWCRAVWQGELESPAVDEENRTDEFAVVTAAMSFAAQARKLPWEVVELHLKSLRMVAAQFDARWAK